MYGKLGISLNEQKRMNNVAVDVVMDSVSVGTSFKAELSKLGIIFCSFGEAVREHPELVQKYLGSVVPHSDNFFAALNSAVFSDGSFVYVPKGVRCPMELSTYFRINAEGTGQFERTLKRRGRQIDARHSDSRESRSGKPAGLPSRSRSSGVGFGLVEPARGAGKPYAVPRC